MMPTNTASTIAHVCVFITAPLSSAMLAADMVDDGWAKLIAGGGAAALVAGLMVWVLRHVSASNERIAATFSETTKVQAERFHETTTTLLREHRAEASAREDKLIAVLKENKR